MFLIFARASTSASTSTSTSTNTTIARALKIGALPVLPHILFKLPYSLKKNKKIFFSMNGRYSVAFFYPANPAKRSKHHRRKHRDCNGPLPRSCRAHCCCASCLQTALCVMTASITFHICGAPFNQSWRRGQSGSHVRVIVQAGSGHDRVQCRTEVTAPQTSGHVTHGYRLDRTKLYSCLSR